MVIPFPAFPDKKYQIIYADPPWDIKLISRAVRPQQLDMPYKTMSVNEIKRLPVRKIANDEGCHLFLWTTQKFLPGSFDVAKSWGFEYHCLITWDKTYGFVPFSFMWSTEYCLYCYLKDKWMEPKTIGIKTLIREKPSKHSRKPIAMRKLILDYCGDLPRIELFAREKIEGWDTWGDEVPERTQSLLPEKTLGDFFD